MAGKIVQIVSTSCASIVLVCLSLVVNMSEIINRTKELIKNMIINVWSIFLSHVNVHQKVYIIEEELNSQVDKITQLVDVSLSLLVATPVLA